MKFNVIESEFKYKKNGYYESYVLQIGHNLRINVF